MSDSDKVIIIVEDDLMRLSGEGSTMFISNEFRSYFRGFPDCMKELENKEGNAWVITLEKKNIKTETIA